MMKWHFPGDFLNFFKKKSDFLKKALCETFITQLLLKIFIFGSYLALPTFHILPRVSTISLAF